MKEIVHSMKEFVELNYVKHVHYTLDVQWDPPATVTLRVYGITLDLFDERYLLILEISESIVKIADKYPGKDANEAIIQWLEEKKQELREYDDISLSPGRWEE